jgi:DNA-binding CsgD family transcriptional regulator
MRDSDEPVTAVSPATQADADAESRLCDQVRHSPLPVGLFRLPDGRTVEVSDPFVAFAGVDRESLIGKAVADYTEEPETAAASFGLLASGALDGYTRKASFRRPDGELVTPNLWVSACTGPEPPRYAVATVVTTGATPDLSSARDCTSPANLMIGTTDAHWRVDRITGADDAALAYRPEQMLGRSAFDAVYPDDVGKVLMLAAHSTVCHGGTFGRIRLAARAGGWVDRRVSLQPLTGEESNGFAFTVCREADDPQDADPSSQGAEGLNPALMVTDGHRKTFGLAAWMAAFPTALRAPELSTLTAREYEIVLRLASGHRVRTIADDLHLSRSTVRNHLTAVFRKFDVSSQAELLARLRPVPAGAGDPVPGG